MRFKKNTFCLLIAVACMMVTSCGKDSSDGGDDVNDVNGGDDTNEINGVNEINDNHDVSPDLSSYEIINGNHFMYAGIPDKYNTGCDPNTSFATINEDGYAGELYVRVQVSDGVKSYVVQGARIDASPDEITVKDYDFSDGKMRTTQPDIVANVKKIRFVNCKFNGFANAKPYETNKMYFTFEHCTFTGGVNEVNITLKSCRIGGFIGDAMNPLKNFNCYDTFVCDLLPAANVTGTHIDGMQTYGREGCEGGNIMFDNVRFEFPSIHYDGYDDNCNACIMFQLEYGNVSNCTFQNLYCNGGGKWYPLYVTDGKKGKTFVQDNLAVKNVKVSDNFGTIFYADNFDQRCKVENVEHFSEIYVSSIFVGSDGKMHVICSNDSHIDHSLTIKTDKDEYEFPIPHCPSNWALNGVIDTKTNPDEPLKDHNGRPYTQYRYADMPFDIDCVVDMPAKYVNCLSGGKEILKVEL